MAAVLFLLFVCVFSVAEGKQDFFDCTGNDTNTLTRRCCNSMEIPHGCECFDISAKSYFRNSVFALPQCPDTTPVFFHLYSRNYTEGIRINADNLLDIEEFDTGKTTHFIVHGFTADGSRNWMKAMRMAFLSKYDCNVIVVDWGVGAQPPYNQAVANIRTTSALMGQLISQMKDMFGVSLDAVHLIGHSLGAHVVGLAGQEVKRLTGELVGRISGLDPAGPFFLIANNIVILDRTDAKFVDIIHTNGNVQGMMKPTGHADFYPNGGQRQTGCALIDSGCSHSRAHEVYLSSLLDFCTYEMSHLANSSCEMGYHADSSCSGVFKAKDFQTTGTFPYCFDD